VCILLRKSMRAEGRWVMHRRHCSINGHRSHVSRGACATREIGGRHFRSRRAGVEKVIHNVIKVIHNFVGVREFFQLLQTVFVIGRHCSGH